MQLTFILICVLGLSGSMGIAGTPVTPDASPEARALLNYIHSTYGEKTLSGQMWASWGIDEINTVHDITGKYPALRGQDYIHENDNKRENELAIEWWSDLKRIADHLTELRDANVPVLWRPMHECDGNWFWYGKQGGERFVKLWRIMFNYFSKERKLNNLIWVLCHTNHVSRHNKDELIRIYNHDLILTRDELPSIMDYLD